MKNVVITGSTRGIGHGLAREFLKRNCRAIITGRTADKVDAAVARFAGKFGADRVAGAVCEVTSFESLQSLWNYAAAAFGPVDIWINNAGMSIRRAPLSEQDPADLAAIAQTNLVGALYSSKAAIAGMLAQGHGQVWNMEGFGSGGEAAPGMTAYGCTKRAVAYLNKALQKEVKGTGVQVCALSPGIVVTDLLVGDYDLASQEWQRAKKVLNILGDTVETVTPWLVDGVLRSRKTGTRVVWMTRGKAFRRFAAAGFSRRDLFADFPGA